MRIITIEEHITGTALDDAVRKRLLALYPYYGYTLRRDQPYYPDFELYTDMGDKRLADMDAHGIDMQVISCPAQSQQFQKIPTAWPRLPLCPGQIRKQPLWSLNALSKS